VIIFRMSAFGARLKPRMTTLKAQRLYLGVA
jgi:hypothetical protein